MPFGVNRCSEFEVLWTFTAHEHFLATRTGERYELVLDLTCRFMFPSFVL